MKIEKSKQPQNAVYYEAPLTTVIGCSVEGLLCLSANVSTESYDVLGEMEW